MPITTNIFAPGLEIVDRNIKTTRLTSGRVGYDAAYIDLNDNDKYDRGDAVLLGGGNKDRHTITDAQNAAKQIARWKAGKTGGLDKNGDLKIDGAELCQNGLKLGFANNGKFVVPRHGSGGPSLLSLENGQAKLAQMDKATREARANELGKQVGTDLLLKGPLWMLAEAVF